MDAPHAFPEPATPAQRTAARIAGLLYVITMATSVYPFFVGPTLLVSGDAAQTASNIVAHAQAFRTQAIVADLLTCLGCVGLNAALYQFLAPVQRSIARVALMFRLVESAVYGAIIVNSLVVLSLLTGAGYREAFEPRQLEALARLFLGAKSIGFIIAMLFLAVGSTFYMHLLLRSRYVPKVLGLVGVCGYPLGAFYFFGLLLFPAWINATSAAVRALPPFALVLLAIIFVPLFAYEFILGFWLLLKGIRLPEQPSLA